MKNNRIEDLKAMFKKAVAYTLTFTAVVLFAVPAYAQRVTPDAGGGGVPGIPGPISGSTSVTSGQVAAYSISAVTGATSYSWSVSPSSAASVTTSTTTSVSITWSSSYAGSAAVKVAGINSSGTGSPNSLSVTVSAPTLASGTISPASQTINYNTAAAAVTATAATGGTGGYGYQWQSAPDGSTWSSLSGATTLSYSPGVLTSTAYYRLVTTSGSSSVNSAAATVTVYPKLAAGTISPSNEWIMPGGTAGVLTSAAATGGKGTYTYQWQSSATGSSWANLSGATALSYSPGKLSGSMYYQLLSTSNGVSVNSLTVPVTVSQCKPLNTAATAAMNYVLVSTPRVSGITSMSGYTGLTACQLMQTVQYIDGLGRPLQTVAVSASPAYNDMVQPLVYDQFGRDSVTFLPYSVNSATPGAYRANAVAGTSGTYASGEQYQFYQQTGQNYVTTAYPYAGTAYEPSAENRVVETGDAGTSWQLSAANVTGGGHTVKAVFTVNNSTSFASDTVNGNQVTIFNVIINSDGSRGLSNGGYYAAGTLNITITKDENWTSGRAGTTEEYKDMQGKVVLKRTFNYTGGQLQQLSTYYVYDDFELLCYVLPPQSNPDNMLMTQATYDNTCYQYWYDQRYRLFRKKLPGKGWEFIVYNILDQVVMSQDANQRNQTPQLFGFTKYDPMGRVIITGSLPVTGSSADNNMSAPYNGYLLYIQNIFNLSTNPEWENRNNSTVTGYDGLSDPNGTGYTYYTINYYDDYQYTGQPSAFVTPAGSSVMTRGLLTGSKTIVLNTAGNATPDMLWAVPYYDDLGRAVQQYKQHYLGGSLSPDNYDVVANTYDFTNELTASVRQHYNTTSTSAPVVTIANTYVYDQAGRKVQTWEGLNGATQVLLSQLVYNEIGQAVTKQLHSTSSGSSFLQNIAYTYNERGWLLSSSAPLFKEVLQYNNVSGISGITPGAEYNGNIASQSWETNGAGSYSSYVYNYDPLNRLTAGNCTVGNSENGIAYDPAGNITALNRYQTGTAIDNLAYNYTLSGIQVNQLQSVADGNSSNTGLVSGTTAYSYDMNGNTSTVSNTVNTTQNKNISYNVLNLPLVYTLTAGTSTFTYDGEGRKLRKVSVISGTATTTDYDDGIQYAGGTISFIQTEEGRTLNSGGNYHYEYSLGDHLGNERASFDTYTGTAVLVQTDDYYPFGMENNSKITSPKNDYLYNKKELQEELGQYDYGARFYDPVIGRFTTIDPVATHFPWMTSYQYASNNPVSKVDLDGLEGIFADFFLEEDAIIPKTSGYSSENIAKAGGDIADEETTSSSTTQNHHVSPNQLKDNPFIQEAREGGFKQDGIENKIEADKYDKSTGQGQHGNHPQYNKGFADKVGQLAKDNADATPAGKAEALRNLVKDIKELIKNNPNIKINDLFKNIPSIAPAVQDNVKRIIPNIKPVVQPAQQKKNDDSSGGCPVNTPGCV